jgi:hypothetical protein
MGNKGFFKRMLPFLATFMVGLFVAGLFSGFGGGRFRGRGWERRHECERMRSENEQLREENQRLRNGNGASGSDHGPGLEDENWDSQSVDEPVLPPPPKMHRLPKHDR